MTSEEFNAKRTKVREEWIAKEMESKGCVRMIAAMKYDFGVAPRTTNRTQLKEMGIDIGVAPSHDLTQQAIDALAKIGVFFVGTENVPKDVFIRVFQKIINDEVVDLPYNPDCTEFIDVSENQGQESVETFVFPVFKRNFM
jgi:hypothetical protein